MSDEWNDDERPAHGNKTRVIALIVILAMVAAAIATLIGIIAAGGPGLPDPGDTRRALGRATG